MTSTSGNTPVAMEAPLDAVMADSVVESASDDSVVLLPTDSGLSAPVEGRECVSGVHVLSSSAASLHDTGVTHTAMNGLQFTSLKLAGVGLRPCIGGSDEGELRASAVLLSVCGVSPTVEVGEDSGTVAAVASAASTHAVGDVCAPASAMPQRILCV